MFIFSEGRPKTVNLIRDRKNVYAGRPACRTAREKDGTVVTQSAAKAGRAVKEYGARLNIWEIAPNSGNTTSHPATFPVNLAKDHILTWSAPGDVVLDPFMGSGSTAIACIETGRQYMGFEIDELYFAESEQRIRDFLKEGCNQ